MERVKINDDNNKKVVHLFLEIERREIKEVLQLMCKTIPSSSRKETL